MLAAKQTSIHPRIIIDFHIKLGYDQERQEDNFRLVYVRLGEFRLHYHSSRGASAKLLRARHCGRKGRPNREHGRQRVRFVGSDDQRRCVLCISVRSRPRRDIGLLLGEEEVLDVLRLHRQHLRNVSLFLWFWGCLDDRHLLPHLADWVCGG